MKRTILCAALALTLGAVACERDDVPGVTTTTSATMAMEMEPIDRSFVAQPPPLVPTLEEPEIQDEGRGRIEALRLKGNLNQTDRSAGDRGTMAP
jgi:hypothetical protein